MSIESMEFVPSDGLRDASYSKTTPDSETDIRAEIQGISDQLRNYVNDTLIPAITDLDGESVKDNGNQTIAGVKTFSSSPLIPTPTANMEASTKKYVDDVDNSRKAYVDNLDNANVKKTGEQTIAGVKTFESSPIVPAPTTDMQPTTKKYVDDVASGVNSGLQTQIDKNVSDIGLLQSSNDNLSTLIISADSMYNTILYMLNNRESIGIIYDGGNFGDTTQTIILDGGDF